MAVLSIRIVAILLLLWAGIRWRAARQVVTTTAARVEGHLAPVVARVDAFVLTVRVDDGAPVRSGDTLVLLDDRDLRLRLAEREADLATVRRTVAPGTRAGLALAQFDAAKALAATTEGRDQHAALAIVRSAEAALLAADPQVAALVAGGEQARRAIEGAIIVSPIDGIVAERAVELGMRTRQGQQLMVILPLHDLWVTADLAPHDAIGVRAGDSAEVRVKAVPDRRFAGVVELLGTPGSDGPAGDPRVTVRIKLIGPIDSVAPLRPGMRAKVRISHTPAP